jgi:hypothetical protein
MDEKIRAVAASSAFLCLYFFTMNGIPYYRLLACLMLVPAPAAAQTAGDVHVSLTLASDYKHNGLSQTASGT